MDFPGREKSRWLWGYLQILGPKNPWHRLRFHKPSQSCNLLAPSSGVSGGWFRWKFFAQQVEEWHSNCNFPGLLMFFSGSGETTWETCENYLRALKLYETSFHFFLVNTNIPTSENSERSKLGCKVWGSKYLKYGGVGLGCILQWYRGRGEG